MAIAALELSLSNLVSLMVSFRLRLDDGSYIARVDAGPSASTSTAARTNAPTAFEQNLLTDKDAQRLEKLLASARALAPAPVYQDLQGNAKKARMDSGALNEAFTLGIGGDWTAKCKGLLSRIANVLGKDKHAFWSTIDPNLVKDYYTIIKDPIFFGQIENKLRNRQYRTPFEFHADVSKMFFNCMLYNPIGDYFRLLAERASADYELAWAATGFTGMNPTSFQGGGIDTGPGKRSKAGQARQKFEPDTFDAPPSSKAKAGGLKNPKVMKDAPISEARKREMGEQMQSEAMENHMEQFMSLLPPELLEGADGEFELDFEALDDPTLRKIDVFLRGIFGPPAGAVAAGARAADLMGSDELDDLLEDDDMSLSVELDDESDDD